MSVSRPQATQTCWFLSSRERSRETLGTGERAGPSGDKKQIAALLMKARANADRKNHRGALAALDELLEIDPDHAQAKRLRGELSRHNPIWWLAKARAETRSISGNWRALSLRMVAWSQAKVGDISGAHKTAEEIDNARQKARACCAIAEAQAKAGDVSGALATMATVDAISPGGCPGYLGAWASVAVAQTEKGDVSGARATTGRIKDGRDRAWTHAKMAAELAAKIDHDGTRASVLTGIAYAQAEAGDVEGCRTSIALAMATNEQAWDPTDPDRIYWQMARVLAKLGDLPAAKGILERIKGARCRSYALHDLVTAYLASADFAEAVSAAEQTPEARGKCEAYREIAGAQVEHGDVPGAKRSFVAARQVAVQVNDIEALCMIAWAQAQADQLTEIEEWAGSLDTPLQRCSSYYGAAGAPSPGTC